MFDNKLLDQWCENIQADGYKIESAFASEDEVYIGFSVNNVTKGLFNNKDNACKTFSKLMPIELMEECNNNKLKLTCGSSSFIFSESKRELTLGYVIYLRRI